MLSTRLGTRGLNQEREREGGDTAQAGRLARLLHQEDSVDAAVVLRVVGHLSVLAPDYLTTRGDQAKLADVDFNNGTLGDDTLQRQAWCQHTTRCEGAQDSNEHRPP